jgi:hypothetical protein
MPIQDLLAEICTRQLRGLTRLSRDEVRLAGYPDTMEEIVFGQSGEPRPVSHGALNVS